MKLKATKNKEKESRDHEKSSEWSESARRYNFCQVKRCHSCRGVIADRWKTRFTMKKPGQKSFFSGKKYLLSPNTKANFAVYSYILSMNFVDQEMLFADHVRRLASLCFYWLRQLRSIRRTLTTETTTILVHALVISRIDYCNGYWLALTIRRSSASASSSPQRCSKVDRL